MNITIISFIKLYICLVMNILIEKKVILGQQGLGNQWLVCTKDLLNTR